MEDQEIATQQTIPAAEFVEDVDAFMKKANNPAPETILKRLEENLNKYRYLQSNLTQKKRRLKAQIPEISTSLELLQHLQKKSDDTTPMETRFMLSDQVYAKAEVLPTKTVGVWLGANTMVEYSLEDAQALLARNLATAQKNLAQVKEDLGFLRDQCTTTEVNMARVYNWHVSKRRDQQRS
ncbi:prefoldin subunit 3-like [Sycon ciliatum]|uniref:prefoldin subunit 3-like n=1 Tax=Sycon ciliatum TaxID=27933 RepID=UPI0020AAD0E5|eukprot:scpid99545/ scgid29071/ Prefoldin subunit 3; Von Hippel-Lindau-binding protein 1